MTTIKIFEPSNKIKRVGIIKRTMFEIQHPFQVRILMIDHKIVGSIIHQFNQFFAFIDDGFALSPSQNCRPKSHDFDVLFFRKKMRNTNRVVWNEVGLIVL